MPVASKIGREMAAGGDLPQCFEGSLKYVLGSRNITVARSSKRERDDWNIPQNTAVRTPPKETSQAVATTNQPNNSIQG